MTWAGTLRTVRLRVDDPQRFGAHGASLQTAVAALERAIAEDTVRNEYVFRARTHGWLTSGVVSSDVASLNEKI